MNTEPGKIYARMADAMSEIGAVAKTSRNQAQNFNFRGIDAVMNELHGILKKNRIFILQDLLESSHEAVTTRNGTMMTHHFNRIKYTFTTDDGSSVSVSVLGESSDSGDKGANKCMAVALKYALTQVFCIPTEDQGEPKDPDAQSHEFVSEKPEEPKKAVVLPEKWEDTIVSFPSKLRGEKFVNLSAVARQHYVTVKLPILKTKKNLSEEDKAFMHGMELFLKANTEEVKGGFMSTVVEVDCETKGKKLSELSNSQIMSLYNLIKPDQNISPIPEVIKLKEALMAWKKQVEEEL